MRKQYDRAKGSGLSGNKLDVNNVCEFNLEIKRLKENENRKRYELKRALDESRAELLKVNRDYGDLLSNSIQTTHVPHFTSSSTPEFNLGSSASFSKHSGLYDFKSRWKSEPALNIAHKNNALNHLGNHISSHQMVGNLKLCCQELKSDHRTVDKKILHANYAHTVSTGDLYEDWLARRGSGTTVSNIRSAGQESNPKNSHFLKPITKPQASRRGKPHQATDNRISQAVSDSAGRELAKKEMAASNPNKNNFNLPKPMDYMRSSQQQAQQHVKEQQMLSRIFRQYASVAVNNTSAHTTPATLDSAHYRMSLQPLTAHTTPAVHQTVPLGAIKRGHNKITVHLPNPYSMNTPEVTMLQDDSARYLPNPPNNTPVLNIHSEVQLNVPLMNNKYNCGSETNEYSPDPGGSFVASVGSSPSAPKFDCCSTKPRKTSMDYDFSMGKSSEMVNLARGKDNDDARRRVLHLLNQKGHTDNSSIVNMSSKFWL